MKWRIETTKDAGPTIGQERAVKRFCWLPRHCPSTQWWFWLERVWVYQIWRQNQFTWESYWVTTEICEIVS